jgi:hypothetical protein
MKFGYLPFKIFKPMSKQKKGFNLRSFTTFSLVISTIIMSWSGFILYIAPPGRIANWGTWKLMLFTKTEWQALHTIFSYLFFILFVIHLFFVNWKTFLTYFKSKIKAGLNRKWELATAIVLSGVIFAGTLRSWTPFGPVMRFGEKVKEGWGDKIETPGVLHMENYTLEKVSLILDTIPVTDLRMTLEKNEIRIKEKDSTLRQIAERNATTPAKVYNILATQYNKNVINNESSTGSGQGSGQGFGRYTLETIAKNSGKEVSALIALLKEKGIDAKPETSLRDIASQLQASPREVYEMLADK